MDESEKTFRTLSRRVIWKDKEGKHHEAMQLFREPNPETLPLDHFEELAQEESSELAI